MYKVVIYEKSIYVNIEHPHMHMKPGKQEIRKYFLIKKKKIFSVVIFCLCINK